MSQLDDFKKRVQDRQRQVRLYEGQLVKQMKAIRLRLYLAVAEIVTGMAVDKAGRLLFNIQNINKQNRVGIVVENQLRKERENFFKVMIRRIFGILTTNKRYADVFDNRDTIDARVQRKILSIYGYDEKSQQFLPGSYLDAVMSGSYTAQNAIQRIQTALGARMSLKEFRTQFRHDFNALTDAEFRRFTFDFFQELDRRAAYEYAQQIGLNHALYAGTLVEDSRQFCVERVNRIYTEAEIVEWNDLNWQGKRPGDVRAVLGGYNCRHTLNWISAEFAELLADDLGIKINTYNKVRQK